MKGTYFGWFSRVYDSQRREEAASQQRVTREVTEVTRAVEKSFEDYRKDVEQAQEDFLQNIKVKKEPLS